MKTTKMFLLLVFALAAVVHGQSAYRQRQLEMRNLAASSNGIHKATVQSCRDQPFDQGAKGRIDQRLANLANERDAAFDIIILIRILFCGQERIDGAVEGDILNVLAPIPFWLEADESVRVYWTENQQIMWMSSEWLLQERYPGLKQYSATLRQRLVHYLKMKIDYGFVEFFSSVYFPYTLGGLMNLVDFCNDSEIQSLALEAVEKLLGLILLVSNDEGAFLAAAGRNYNRYYFGDPAILGVIWMILGTGNKPVYTHHVTSFLSTSTMNVVSVIQDYQKTLDGFDGSIYAGPSLFESFDYNKDLSRVDRIIFQWSMGAYFTPDVADDTQYLIDALNLSGHGEFADFSDFAQLPDSFGNFGAQLLASVTRSSVTAGFNVEIFREGPSVLTSVRNFWAGRVGFQSFPWMATTGTLPVWTQSGTVMEDWSETRGPSNTHLPMVKQDGNIALIMYNRNNDLSLAGAALDFDVSLQWPKGFTEEREIGRWKIGHEAQLGGFVAVARHCTDKRTVGNEEIPVCTVEHQTWAVVVGNSKRYGNFNNFVGLIQQANYQHSYKWEWRRFRNVFRGKIEFDGTTIEHEW